jgi:hypothetical protein
MNILAYLFFIIKIEEIIMPIKVNHKSLKNVVKFKLAI